MAEMVREMNNLINKIRFVEKHDLYDKVDLYPIEQRIDEIRTELEQMK